MFFFSVNFTSNFKLKDLKETWECNKKYLAKEVQHKVEPFICWDIM